MPIDNSHFKAKLLAEKENLEKELTSVAQVNPSNSEDWEAVKNETQEDTADRTEVADSISNYEGNLSILKKFEIDLADINRALDKIEKGTYGTCEICNQEIEVARLEANPSARTCIAHKEEVL